VLIEVSKVNSFLEKAFMIDDEEMSDDDENFENRDEETNEIK